jgi:hypothetical protein
MGSSIESDKSLEKENSALEEDSNSLINWFSANKMQANPEKFQAISVGRKTHDKNVMFNLNGINISCEDEVKCALLYCFYLFSVLLTTEMPSQRTIAKI